ncbi:MAG TPA: hypothetical protein VEA41_09560 [Salinarimonas sp.]|nr:hypothetical protein [Salinarimonas sp.]
MAPPHHDELATTPTTPPPAKRTKETGLFLRLYFGMAGLLTLAWVGALTCGALRLAGII